MEIFIVVIVLIFSAIIHEVMHGFVAEKLGDPTARLMGRLTLNPLPHIDPISSVLIPALLIAMQSPIIFGAAKPVPVNPLHFKDGRKDLALVALSGPLTNLSLAVVGSLLFKMIPTDYLVLKDIMHTVVYLNLILAFINLIPVPPLDGSKVFSIVLPDELTRVYFSLEPYGIFILFFLLLSPIGGLSLGALLNELIMFSLKIFGM